MSFRRIKKVNEMGVKFEILFLNASNRILIKRYKETRRNHPLARNGRIEDGIEKEREAVDVLKTCGLCHRYQPASHKGAEG